MADVVVLCPSCGAPASFSELVPFRAECEKCTADLHVCVACRFYDRYVENECRETEADPVAKKDRANLCEYFKPRGAAVVDASAEAKKKLEALFGAKGSSPTPAQPTTPEDPAAAARAKLDALFKKKPE